MAISPQTLLETPVVQYGMEPQQVPSSSSNTARKGMPVSQKFLSSSFSLTDSSNIETGPPLAQSTEARFRLRRGFLSLPIELRYEIYSFLLVVDPSMDASDDLNKPLLFCLQILQLNRQIREEALHVVLHKNVWIHFQIGPITVSQYDSYHIYQLGDNRRYSQPNIPVNGFLAERVRQRLAADVKITQESELVEEPMWDAGERAEVRKDILFAYNEGRYNHLCHLIRRFGSRAIKCLNISVRFPEHKFWRLRSSNMRLGLVELLLRTKNTLSFTIHGAAELQDSFKIAADEWRSYSQNVCASKQFNDELEEIISESAIELSRGLYNGVRCRLSYVDDIQAIHSQIVVENDPDEEARQKVLERDLFVIQVLSIALDEKNQPNSAANLLRKLDLMCEALWFREGDRAGLLGYACGFLNRRVTKARRSRSTWH